MMKINRISNDLIVRFKDVSFGLKNKNHYFKLEQNFSIVSLRVMLSCKSNKNHHYNKKDKRDFLNFCKGIITYRNDHDLKEFFLGKGMLLSLVEVLRQDFRNRAAHTATISKTDMEECKRLVVTTRKLIKILADRYKE